jgi:hypothetical protein
LIGNTAFRCLIWQNHLYAEANHLYAEANHLYAEAKQQLRARDRTSGDKFTSLIAVLHEYKGNEYLGKRPGHIATLDYLLMTNI